MRLVPRFVLTLVSLGVASSCLYAQISGQGIPSQPLLPLQPALPGQFGEEPYDPLAPPQEPGAGALEPNAAVEASHGSFAVKVVGGRLVAHCEISTVHRRIPVNLFIDLESPSGLQLHNNAADPLRAENAAGETIPLQIHFPEFTVTLEHREAGPEAVFNEFTRLYSREIGEDALVGALGAKFFKDYAVTLDLHRGFIEIAPPVPLAETEDRASTSQSEDPAILEVSLTTTDDVIWVPVETPDGKVASMALATAEPDSLIDQVWCDNLGYPAGNVKPIRLGGIDFSERVAFRPAEINYVHQDGALGVIGLDLLQQLRVELDQARTRARIQFMVPPEFPAADLAFYEALVADDPDLYEAFLTSHPEARHSQEAATCLLRARIDEDAEPDAFDRAIAWLAATWRKDIVSTRALDLMKELKEAGYPQAALKAGEFGVKGGREDRYPNSVHHLHASMGDLLLAQNDDEAAWRHLLSAAFGLPEDGMINLRLGECYEHQKRYQRAMSRYIQAVVDVDSGEQAVAGLERVTKLLGDEDRLSVERIEQMVAGKTYGYTAATRYRPEDDNASNRVVLVEFFTNAHIKHPSRDEGAVGGALGNEGLMSYFSRENVAMLAYHLPHAQLAMDSLTNEVAQAQADVYGAPPTVQLVNGVGQIPGVGKARDAEALFKHGREVVREALSEPSPLTLNLKAQLEGDALGGELTIALEAGERNNISIRGGKVHLVLAERSVLYPGRSKVIIHRMVARAALTRSVLGESLNLDQDGVMKFKFHRSLREIEQGNRVYLEQLQAEGVGAVQPFAARMDPHQLTLVAFVRNEVTREVLQAVQINPKVIRADETSS